MGGRTEETAEEGERKGREQGGERRAKGKEMRRRKPGKRKRQGNSGLMGRGRRKRGGAGRI
jgi:hypothetical protein